MTILLPAATGPRDYVFRWGKLWLFILFCLSIFEVRQLREFKYLWVIHVVTTS